MSSCRLYLRYGLLTIALVMLPAAGQQPTARQDGKAFGGATSNLPGNALSQPDAAGTVPGYGGTDLSEKTYIHGNMYDAGVVDATNDEAAQLLKDSFQGRPSVPVGRDDPWMDNYWTVQNDPRSVVPDFTGQYGDCTSAPGGTSPPTDRIRACDEYTKIEGRSCNDTQIVEVDQDQTYRCQRTNERRPEECPMTRDVQVDQDPVYDCTVSSATAPQSCTMTRDVGVDSDPIYRCNVLSTTRPEECRVTRQVATDADYIYSCAKSGEKSPSSCTIGRQIDVRADYTYSCKRTRDYQTKTCDVYYTAQCTSIGQCYGGAVALTWEEWDCQLQNGNRCYMAHVGVSFGSGSPQNSISVSGGGCGSPSISEGWAGDRSSVTVSAQCRQKNAPSPGGVQWYYGCCNGAGASMVDECANI